METAIGQSEDPRPRPKADLMNSTLITPRHIVIRGVNWLGDAVMTTPAVLRLRERFPEARITLLCQDKLHDLWISHPAVDAVQTFKTGDRFLSVASRLRSIDADLAVIMDRQRRIRRRVAVAASLSSRTRLATIAQRAF